MFLKNGNDITRNLVKKSYFFTAYPSLSSVVKSPKLLVVGANNVGQLGTGDLIGVSTPVQTISGGMNWKQVSAGSSQSAAIKTDGSLWCWGQNTYGQLGDGTIVDKYSPVQVSGAGTNWLGVFCGGTATFAIKNDATLWGFGQNNFGQFGVSDQVDRSTPVQIFGAGKTWRSVASAFDMTAAINTDGSLWLSGNNNVGQLGNPAVLGMQISPVQTSLGGNTWQQVSCGYGHVAAIKNDGSLWCWGNNSNGQVGDGTIVNKNVPTQVPGVWKQVVCGQYHTTAIKADGSLWGWGYDSYGQLGDGSTTDKSIPVQTTLGGNDWRYIASTQGSQTAAIKTDGTLWVCGYNFYGELGTGDTVDRHTPVQIVTGGTSWKNVACGYNYLLAIEDNDPNL